MAKHTFDRARLDAAETIALQALGYLLGEPRLLQHFMNETGLSPQELVKSAAGGEGLPRSILEAALTVFVQDDALLLTFAANSALDPADVTRAHAILATDDGRLTPQWSS